MSQRERSRRIHRRFPHSSTYRCAVDSPCHVSWRISRWYRAVSTYSITHRILHLLDPQLRIAVRQTWNSRYLVATIECDCALPEYAFYRLECHENATIVRSRSLFAVSKNTSRKNREWYFLRYLMTSTVDSSSVTNIFETWCNSSISNNFIYLFIY